MSICNLCCTILRIKKERVFLMHIQKKDIYKQWGAMSSKQSQSECPPRATFSRNFQCKAVPFWLSKFFHFDAENGEEPEPPNGPRLSEFTPIISIR